MSYAGKGLNDDRERMGKRDRPLHTTRVPNQIEFKLFCESCGGCQRYRSRPLID